MTTKVDETRKDTVLIVDDSKLEIDVLTQLLKPEHAIQTAQNAYETIEILSKESLPDLILLDVVMPQIDGFELCKKLKSNSTTKDIPIIFLTSMDGAKDETKGLEYGAVDYITKPFNTSIVKARVKTHLELKRRHDLLAQLSSLDGLTQIPNRRRFDEFLELEWNRAIREQHPLSIMMLDIDYFKLYNDNYGHLAGDDCLKKVSQALSEMIHRTTDLLARYGGEEFVVVLPNTGITGLEFLSKIIHTYINKLHIPHAFSLVSDRITFSMGGATIIPSTESSSTKLLEHTDKALYQSKENGRNQFTGIDLRV